MISFFMPGGPTGWLSNWHPCEFRSRGTLYTSMEQFMMHRKALTFGDMETASAIMCTTDCEFIKSMGRKVKNYDDVYWNGMRQPIVFEGLLAKYSQNEDLREKLLATGDELLVEASPYDKIWGAGLSALNPAIFDHSNWPGQNLLGFTTMAVRELLRA